MTPLFLSFIYLVSLVKRFFNLTKETNWVVEDKKKGIFWPSEEMKKRANISDPAIYEKALKDPQAFWGKRAEEGLDWFKKWDKVYEEDKPFFKWFLGGKINVSYSITRITIKSVIVGVTALV